MIEDAKTQGSIVGRCGESVTPSVQRGLLMPTIESWEVQIFGWLCNNGRPRDEWNSHQISFGESRAVVVRRGEPLPHKEHIQKMDLQKRPN